MHVAAERTLVHKEIWRYLKQHRRPSEISLSKSQIPCKMTVHTPQHNTLCYAEGVMLWHTQQACYFNLGQVNDQQNLKLQTFAAIN